MCGVDRVKLSKSVNIIFFRFIIILMLILHILFMTTDQLNIIQEIKPIYLLPYSIWLSLYIILFISAIAMIFLINIFKHIFLLFTFLALLIVATQGSVILTPYQNLLLQFTSSLYGVIIYMSYFTNIFTKDSI